MEDLMNWTDNLYFFPPGYVFSPTDEELVRHYLMKRILNQPLPSPNIVRDLDIYEYSPKQLDDMFQRKEYEKELYFFTPRNKRYRNGSRPARFAGSGFWKATGGDRPVPKNGPTIGYEKALVFYEGKPQKRPTKTNWIMHEYRLLPKNNEPNVINTSTATTATGAPDGDMKLDGLVLCKIYQTVKKNRSSNTTDIPDGGGGHTGHSYDPTLQLDHQFHPLVDHQLPPLINYSDPLQMTDTLIFNNARSSGWSSS